jgi:hypothetical protein
MNANGGAARCERATRDAPRSSNQIHVNASQLNLLDNFGGT